MGRLVSRVVAVGLTVAGVSASVLVGPAAAQASIPQYNRYFSYAQAYQWVNSVGAESDIAVFQPTVTRNDHSLAEMAVKSADGQQAIEVGWTVDQALNGDNLPHLFVHRWVNGGGQVNGDHCYNRCGFVPREGIPVPAGAALQPGTTAAMMIKHYTQPASGWWIRYQNNWLGYFPDELWDGAFTSAAVTQWFGEVTSAGPTPGCIQMGNGTTSNSANAATISGMYHLLAGDKTQQANVGTEATDPDYFTTTKVNNNTIRYGGTGSCD